MQMDDWFEAQRKQMSRASDADVLKIAKEAYPDPTQFDSKSDHYAPESSPQKPYWYQVDVQFVKAFSKPLSLEQVKTIPALKP